MTRMDCGEVRDLLQAFDDDELSVSERSSVAGHLHHCTDCTRELNQLRALRNRIRAAGTYITPPNLATRVRNEIGNDGLHQMAFGWRRLALLAASHCTVAIFGATLAYFSFSAESSRSAILQDVVAAHVRSLISDQLLQVASADTHTVRPWFMGKVPFSPDVVDLVEKGFPLLGARIDYVRDRPAAAVVYGRRKHRINVFIQPAATAAVAESITAVRNGFNVMSWQYRNFSYFAVSDLNASELQDFAQHLKGPQPQ